MWETPMMEVAEVDIDTDLAAKHAMPCVVEVPLNLNVACDHLSCM